MTTVLLLPGAYSFGNTETLMKAFGGPRKLLNQLGDPTTPTITPVPYIDWDPIFGYLNGAMMLDQAIHHADRSANIVVFGHSYGAVSINQWLRQYGPTCSVLPAWMKFVLIGNSCRPGAKGATPNGLAAQFGLFGGVGPMSTKYTVYDCARQWDKWADYPNNYSSSQCSNAVNNCNSGDMYPDNIHVSYEHINLTTPTATATVDNVTFQFFKTDPVPLPHGNRTQIEQAYKRIV
jgi:PE-PPE domain